MTSRHTSWETMANLSVDSNRVTKIVQLHGNSNLVRSIRIYFQSDPVQSLPKTNDFKTHLLGNHGEPFCPQRNYRTSKVTNKTCWQQQGHEKHRKRNGKQDLTWAKMAMGLHKDCLICCDSSDIDLNFNLREFACLRMYYGKQPSSWNRTRHFV